ncbi:MAG: abortive infection family protein, partial [Candidatus Pacebacteria bacterium]|nr:abortive infection family protein [Candidatus Paceibacterota bacterium]
KLYIEKWHIVEEDYNDYWENFKIIQKESKEIDLLPTLHTIEGETLIKIAIDLGVETLDFIPLIPTFRNEIKSDYGTASSTFEKAFKQIEEHPDIAIGLVNSALESIAKKILKDERIKTKLNSKKTLYDLTIDLVKEFQLFPNSDMPVEIKTIGSSLLAITQSIEKLRSEKTGFHGKTREDYIIKNSIYTYFVVNAVSTIGKFLISFYKHKFLQDDTENKEIVARDELEWKDIEMF